MDIQEFKRLAGIVESDLDESSPGRVLQHIQDAKPFFVISPEREYRSEKQNREAMKALKHHLGKADVGYFEQHGVWSGIPETSIFVLPRRNLDGPDLKMFQKYAENMMRKFDQEAIVFSDGDRAVFINQDGSIDDYDLDSITFSSKEIDKPMNPENPDDKGFSSIKGTRYLYKPYDDVDSENRDQTFKFGSGRR